MVASTHSGRWSDAATDGPQKHPPRLACDTGRRRPSWMARQRIIGDVGSLGFRHTPERRGG